MGNRLDKQEQENSGNSEVAADVACYEDIVQSIVVQSHWMTSVQEQLESLRALQHGDMFAAVSEEVVSRADREAKDDSLGSGSSPVYFRNIDTEDVSGDVDGHEDESYHRFIGNSVPPPLTKPRPSEGAIFKANAAAMDNVS